MGGNGKTEETINHRQNNNVKEMRIPPVPSNLFTSLTAVAVLIAERSKVTETVSEKQLLKPEGKKPCPALYDSPAPPPSF